MTLILRPVHINNGFLAAVFVVSRQEINPQLNAQN